ncbi:MAG TPA: DUF2332 domain-containing protein [Mycobacteriales bacterium]|nr:DUF2332 domain-containing protein [Mycobacteriales bacterium]
MADRLWHTARHFRRQADDCRELGSPLYAGLLDHIAADLEGGGVSSDLLAEHPADRGDGLLPLRLMGGVHALVLSRQAPELALFYPSVGGTADPGADADLAWPALRDLLAGQADTIRPWLDRAPQTNEVGRGAALVGAMCQLAAVDDLPIRLFEVGASAGLNLRADRFHITGAGASYGDPASPVRLLEAWRGVRPPDVPLRVVERSGGDLAPIDPATTEGRLTLTAYVWADQVARIERLRGALAIAAAVPAQVRAENAIATVSRLTPTHGTWTLLWHSIFRQYLSQAERDALSTAIAAVGAAATPAARFAHVFLEPASPADGGFAEVIVTTWPGATRRRVGVAAAHGIPTTWLEEATT